MSLKAVSTALVAEPQASVVPGDLSRHWSPVPHLTSIHGWSERGNYGDPNYPGNCSGNLIRDLLRSYRPKSVLDPMTGGGTCRDIVYKLSEKNKRRKKSAQ